MGLEAKPRPALCLHLPPALLQFPCPTPGPPGSASEMCWVATDAVKGVCTPEVGSSIFTPTELGCLCPGCPLRMPPLSLGLWNAPSTIPSIHVPSIPTIPGCS